MSMLVIRRDLNPDDHAMTLGDCRLMHHGKLEIRRYARSWTSPLDWHELERGTPGQAHAVTHVCGQLDGAWLDGPLIIFAQDRSVIAAIPSGGPAELHIPQVALAGRGTRLQHAIKLEERAVWRCLRALVADACRREGYRLVLSSKSQDLRSALILLAARQAYPDREILWRSTHKAKEPWQRFLANAGIKIAPSDAGPCLGIEFMAKHLDGAKLERCIAGAHRRSHVIPAVIVRDGIKP